MLPYFLAIITTLATSFLIAFVNHALSVNVQGFSFFYVIPVGAMLVGALAACGLYLGTKIQKTSIKTHFLVLAGLFGLIAFASLNYIDYRLAINDVLTDFESTYEIKISDFSPEEQKEFYDGFYKEASFVAYLREIHDGSVITLSNRGKQVAKIDNPVISAIAFWLSVLGSVAGAILVHTSFVGKRTKDKRSGEYRDLKYVGTFEPEKYDELLQIFDKSKDFSKDITTFLKQNHSQKNAAKEAVYVEFTILKSRKFADGEILIEKKELTGKNYRVIAELKKDLDTEIMPLVMQEILQVNPKEKF